MSQPTPPMFGPAKEPCGSCGTALAADQRYCLACGARRADARLPFLDILRGSDTQLVPFGQPIPGYVAGGAIPPHDGSLAGVARANAGLIGGVGVLLLAMLIGVLIGSNFGSNDQVAQAAPKPQVIQISGAPAASAAPAAVPAVTGAVDPSGVTGGAGAATSTGAADPSGVTGGTGATNKSLDKLQNLSGKDYQKQVDKLGKKISTGGKPPPKDNKAPAAGGSFQDIG